MRLFLAALILALPLSGCANKRTTDIDVEDSGQAYKVKFGTVLEHRVVSVRSENSASLAGGAILGGGAGALIGKTNGAALAGLLVGAFAGSRIHWMSETDNAVEYTIALSDGGTIIIAQLQGSDERTFERGHPVMVQYGATANRVLTAENLPEIVKRPKQVMVERASPSRIDVKTCDKTSIGRATRDACIQH